MIVGYIGLPAQGKTLGMVYDACKALKDEKRVISNIPITDTIFGSKRQAEYVEDITESFRVTTNALICVDEASIVLPNYFWKKMNPRMLIRFAQVRKYGLDISYTSQGWSHTVKRLRDLTSFVVNCVHHRMWFAYEWLDPEYYYRNVPRIYKKDYLQKTAYIFPPKLKSAYIAFNTLHVVAYSNLMDTDIDL